MKITRSLTFKLILSYLFIILISFGFVSVFLEKNLKENTLQEIKSSLVTQASLISNQISIQSIVNEDIPQLEALLDQLRDKTACRITVVSSRGKVLADSEESLEKLPDMENHANRPEISDALAGKIGFAARYSLTLKENMFYVALPLKEDGRILGAVRLSLLLAQAEELFGTTRTAVLTGVLIALGLVFVFGAYFMARTIRPIKDMIRVSRKLSEGDLSHRILPASHDEIAELAVTLNIMAQRVEDKIREVDAHNQRLEAVFHSMVEGVVVVDKAGRILSVNPTIERIFGIDGKDVVGRSFLEAIRNNDIAEVVDSVLREGKSVSREVPLVLPVCKVFQINAAPVFDGNSINGCLAAIHDITDIKRLETMRSDFVANVSHELKTPLTIIKGFIETLLGGALEDPQNNRHFLMIMQGHVERLNTLVNDLLSLAYLESEESVFRRERIDLHQLAEATLADRQPQWQKRKLTISNELPSGLYVFADKDKLTQVFSNFIDNAIKFNKDNGRLAVSCEDLGSHIKVCVEDAGIGIPEKDLPRIYERFYRVDKARSRELGGTGLGLSIVKHIIERHQGSVGVESVEDLGSKFWFTLPKE